MNIIKYLFGYCSCCRRWFKYPKKLRQNTFYEDPESNWFFGCSDCQEMNEEHWKEMWKEHYGNIM